jgi:transposase
MAGEGAAPLSQWMQEDTQQEASTPALSRQLRGLPRISISEKERADLQELARSRAGEVRLTERALMILFAEAGNSAAEIAEEVGTTPKTVRKWCRRYIEERCEHADRTVKEWLADATRAGRKDTFDELFWVDVLAIATSDPDTYDRPITHWTSRELAAEVVNQKLAKSIHFATIARFLKKCDLRPDRVKEWMNRKPDPDFDERAADVKDCLVAATSDPQPDRATVSFDEKTGMQAKERIAPDKPMQSGRPVRQEFEYKRHGTLVLFGSMLVNTGEISVLLDTYRTNPITADALHFFFSDLFDAGYKSIDVVLDQLNTHWSIDLVEAVAELCGLPLPRSSEIMTGEQRRAWLSDPNKPIVFHYTPKHASWLNPIEIWFGVLVRKVLRRGSFKSTTDLHSRVLKFLEYYNDKLAHPYKFNKWKRIAA